MDLIWDSQQHSHWTFTFVLHPSRCFPFALYEAYEIKKKKCLKRIFVLLGTKLFFCLSQTKGNESDRRIMQQPAPKAAEGNRRIKNCSSLTSNISLFYFSCFVRGITAGYSLHMCIWWLMEEPTTILVSAKPSCPATTENLAFRLPAPYQKSTRVHAPVEICSKPSASYLCAAHLCAHLCFPAQMKSTLHCVYVLIQQKFHSQYQKYQKARGSLILLMIM